MAYCYFDGALLEESGVSVSMHNLGLQRGFGIFDLFRSENGEPVFMEDHLNRFMKSQDFMDLGVRIAKEEIREAVQGLQEWNGYASSTFRLTLLADGNELDEVLRPLFYIINTHMSAHANPEECSVITHEYVREYPEIKNTNYFTSALLHRRKKKSGAIDVLYHKDGLISEASRSNVFMVKDGVMKTPKKNILKGVTRKQILSFAPDVLPTETTSISLDEFKAADEAFLCSTLKEIIPITAVDGSRIGGGNVGPVTRKMQKRFADLRRQSITVL